MSGPTPTLKILKRRVAALKRDFTVHRKVYYDLDAERIRLIQSKSDHSPKTRSSSINTIQDKLDGTWDKVVALSVEVVEAEKRLELARKEGGSDFDAMEREMDKLVLGGQSRRCDMATGPDGEITVFHKKMGEGWRGLPRRVRELKGRR